MILFNLCCGSDTWKVAAQAENIEYNAYTVEQLDTPEKRRIATRAMEDACRWDHTAVLFSHRNIDKELEDYFSALSGAMFLIPVGPVAISLNQGNVAPEHLARINEYVLYGGLDNIRSAIQYLRRYIMQDSGVGEPPAPKKQPFDGIYFLTGDR